MTLLRGLPADTSPALTDLFYMVIDPATTPADRKVAGTAIATLLATAPGLTDKFPAVYGVTPSGATSGATDVTNIEAAIAAASAAGGGTVVLGRGGPWYINDRITVPQSVNLWGQGNGDTHSGTWIMCTTAGAGIAFGTLTTGGRGGVSGNFMVDGDDLATVPLYFGLCVMRTFIALESTRSAGAGWTFESSQNNNFYSCASTHAATIGVLFDQSAQANRFYGFQIDSPGEWYVVFQQTGAPPVGLAGEPLDNNFYGGIFERVATEGGILQTAGQINGFHQVQIVNSENDATFNGVQLDYGLMFIDGCYMASNYNVGTAFKVAFDGTLVITGEPTIIGYATVFDNTGAGVIDINGFVRTITFVTYSTGTAPNQQDNFGLSTLGTIPVASGMSQALTTSAAELADAFFRLDPANWPAAPTGFTLQYRFRVFTMDLTAGDVIGFQAVDDTNSTGLTAELTEVADSTSTPCAEWLSAWLAFPAGAIRGYLQVRNQTAARGIAVSACIEVQHG